MCPSLIEIGSKTAEKNSAQTNRQTDRHYENNGNLAVNQKFYCSVTDINACECAADLHLGTQRPPTHLVHECAKLNVTSAIE